MERVITTQENSNTLKAIAYEKAIEKDMEKAEELSCKQLMRNLLKTNLPLLKVNEISSVLLLF